MFYLSQAIRKLRPNSEFAFKEEDYSTIEWHILEGAAPTQGEIDAAIKKIKADEIVEATEKAAAKAALLERLGITADEAALLLQ